MSEGRIDFSALDPAADEVAFERKVQAVTARAGKALAARRAQYDVVGQLARWRRPMLAAAAILLLASVTALSRVDAGQSMVDPATGIAQAIGVPTQLAEWVAVDDLPTTTQLLEGLGANR